jgi:hypothetical protein
MGLNPAFRLVMVTRDEQDNQKAWYTCQGKSPEDKLYFLLRAAQLVGSTVHSPTVDTCLVRHLYSLNREALAR